MPFFDLVIILASCVGASMLGPICGIGLAVIIKPVVDSLGVMSVATVSFLSSITALAMSSYSCGKSLWPGQGPHESRLRLETAVPISVGSAVGGLCGKALFNVAAASSANPDAVGFTQSMVLVALTVATGVYTLNKDHAPSFHLHTPLAGLVTGLLAGALWAFLGIGGGPFNLVVLFLFFSMDVREATRTSLLIILFSQVASIAYAVLSSSVPVFDPLLALGMASMGIVGAVAGEAVARRVSDHAVEMVYLGTLVVILGICAYDAWMFSAVLG